MDPNLLEHARGAKGFMPEQEGFALYKAGLRAARHGPLFEIGSYCGKSAVYLGAAAREKEGILFSLDHHRGSEEHQPGEEFHDPELVDPRGRVDTLAEFRRTISGAGLDDVVVGLVGDSAAVARWWRTPLGLAFIDGGHGRATAHSDYEGWAPHVMRGGLLVIHDVFEDPSAGGRPPFEIFRRALYSGAFVPSGGVDSLRVLERVGDGI